MSSANFQVECRKPHILHLWPITYFIKRIKIIIVTSDESLFSGKHFFEFTEAFIQSLHNIAFHRDFISISTRQTVSLFMNHDSCEL